uniref:Expansin-like EG45 domain-containing protein n=1 Tax=Kalanchoe fedtschenkoi TaxID=63787 RepID=A0A7N0T9N5_KALFE
MPIGYISFVSKILPHLYLQAMSKDLSVVFLLLLSTMSSLHICHADIGSAARYPPPYLPTACYSSDLSQLRGNGMFASAGEGIWDNGAACGRRYLVRCISAAEPKACIPGRTIQIRIVDRALTSVSRPSGPDSTMVLSIAAFAAIANTTAAASVNIEFQQV